MKGRLVFPFPGKRILVVEQLALSMADGASLSVTEGSSLSVADEALVKGICEDFSRIGCKVALFSDESLPLIQGIRHYHCDVNSESRRELDGHKDVEEAFADLMKAWRDIDMLIFIDLSFINTSSGNTSAEINSEMTSGKGFTEATCAQKLLSLWSEHKRRYPIPSDYGDVSCRSLRYLFQLMIISAVSVLLLMQSGWHYPLLLCRRK